MNQSTIKAKKEKITSLKDLHQTIETLETRRIALESDIKNDFQKIQEELKPSRIIKNTFRELRGSSDISKGILQFAIALAAGYFSKRLLVGKSAGMLKKVMGTALQYGMMALVARKADPRDLPPEGEAMTKGRRLLRKLFSA